MIGMGFRRIALAQGLLDKAPFRHPSLATTGPDSRLDRITEADTTFLPDFSPDFSENPSDQRNRDKGGAERALPGHQAFECGH